jgi:hypothetical protein
MSTWTHAWPSDTLGETVDAILIDLQRVRRKSVADLVAAPMRSNHCHRSSPSIFPCFGSIVKNGAAIRRTIRAGSICRVAGVWIAKGDAEQQAQCLGHA